MAVLEGNSVRVYENENLEDVFTQFPDAEELVIAPPERTDYIENFSLKGIDKAKNLKSLVIESNVFVQNFDEIYKCSKLEKLDVIGQRQLDELDLGKLPKIRRVITIGSGFSVIKGLDKKTPTRDCLYNFINCPSLQEIEGLTEFSEKMIDDQTLMEPILHVDDVFYQRFMSENADLEEKFLGESQQKFGRNTISINVEYTDSVRYRGRMDRGTPMQMKTQRKYLDYIIKDQCHIKDDDSDWVKAKKAYDWLTETMHYAYGMLEFEHCECHTGQYYAPEIFGEQGYDHYFLASTYHSLLNRHDLLPNEEHNGFIYNTNGEEVVVMGDDGVPRRQQMPLPKMKYAVCEGIANTYVQMLQRMGIDAHYASFRFDWQEGGGHAVVCANIDGGNYYFDPTLDLGRRVYAGFGVSRDEIRTVYGSGNLVWCANEERFFEGPNRRRFLVHNDMRLRWEVGSDGRVTRARGLLTDVFNRSILAYRIRNSRAARFISPRVRALVNAFESNVVGINLVHAKHVCDYYVNRTQLATNRMYRRARIGVIVAMYRLYLGMRNALARLRNMRAARNDEVLTAAGEYMGTMANERSLIHSRIESVIQKAKTDSNENSKEQKSKLAKIKDVLLNTQERKTKTLQNN